MREEDTPEPDLAKTELEGKFVMYEGSGTLRLQFRCRTDPPLVIESTLVLGTIDWPMTYIKQRAFVEVGAEIRKRFFMDRE